MYGMTEEELKDFKEKNRKFNEKIVMEYSNSNKPIMCQTCERGILIYIGCSHPLCPYCFPTKKCPICVNQIIPDIFKIIDQKIEEEIEEEKKLKIEEEKIIKENLKKIEQFENSIKNKDKKYMDERNQLFAKKSRFSFNFF